MEPELKKVLLTDIVFSKTNPRKTFDQSKINELAESIVEHGVIQPVRLRPKQNKYELICGERRVKASKQAGRKDIPAVISEMTDQQAREIQLIENFQREDVHPMEEAAAIHSAIKTGHYTVEDLSHKVGKSKKYIAQRLKLNDLIPELQKEFFQNKFTLASALMLVTISKEDQKNFFKNAQENTSYHYDSNQVRYFIQRNQGNLDSAVFDLTDPTLSPDFGPCTTCPFNSANANLLFPDDTKGKVCMNKPDYVKKTEEHFNRASFEAYQDPSIVLLSQSNAYGDEEKKLIDEGHVVLKKWVDYETVPMPVREQVSREDYDTQEDFEDAETEANAAYEKKLLQFEKQQTNGKITKGFVVSGEQKGKTIYIELKKKGEQKTATTVIHAGTAEVNDIVTEIERLKEREVRAKELDKEKIFTKVQSTFNEHKPFLENNEPLSINEYIGLTVSLLSAAGHAAKEALRKNLKIKSSSMYASNDEILEKLLKLQGEALPAIYTFFRMAMLHIMFSQSELNPEKHANAAMITTLAKAYLPDLVADIEIEQQNVAVERIKKLDKRLLQLEEQKYDLEQQSTKKKSVKSLIS